MMKGKKVKMGVARGRRDFFIKVLKGAFAWALFPLIPENVAKALPASQGGSNEGNEQKRPNCVFVIDIAACIGCGTCVAADKANYNIPQRRYRTWIERYVIDERGSLHIDLPSAQPLAELRHHQQGNIRGAKDTFFVPKLCNMCENPACVRSCPTKAVYVNNDGYVLINDSRCVGCGSCRDACSFSVPFINVTTGKAEKCTWCYERMVKGQLPVCVEGCPTSARKVIHSFNSKVDQWKIPCGSLYRTLGEYGAHSKPSVQYAGLRREVL